MPFYEVTDDGSLGDVKKTVDLRQLPPSGRVFQKVWFQLLEGFAYARSSSDLQPIHVHAHDLSRPPGGGNSTDLASVPPMLWGVVASYGLHTMAALLHDQLCNEAAEKSGVWTRVRARADADRLFRDALGESGVPGVRRWLMWAAVFLFGVLAHAPVLGALLLAATLAIPVMAYDLVIGTLWTPLAPPDDAVQVFLIVVAVSVAAMLLDAILPGMGTAPLIGGLGLPVVALPLVTSFLALLVMWIPSVAAWGLLAVASLFGGKPAGPIPPIGPTRV